MFWGLIMEPGRCYTQKVKCSFHVSMAALDISNSSEDPVQVMCVFEGRNYLLCTLNKKDKIQCALDLNFETGTKVSFATNGKAHVHLTGYLVTMQDDIFEEEEEEDEDFIPSQKKKRAPKEVTDGPPNKKSKTAKNSPAALEEEEDSDGEEEGGEEEDSELSGLESEGEEEEEEEEDDVSDEDAEEEEDSSSLSGDEIEETTVRTKQNGIAKPNALTPKKKNEEKVPKEKATKPEKKPQQPPKLKKTVVKGGVIVEDLKEGNGDLVKNGKVVHVYYEGRFKSNNKLFDSTTKGPGFSFRVGKGEVIKGWDFGVLGMKVGGKRRITCPPKVAYGVDGSPPVIPPNSTLVFDVEVKKIS